MLVLDQVQIQLTCSGLCVLHFSDFKLVELHCELNNTDHHTNQISVDQLILRRGQSFKVTLTLTKSFNGDLHPLVVTAMTGQYCKNEGLLL